MSATGGCGCEGPEHSTGRTLSQKGTDKASTHACSLLGGSGVGWFMESPHDFDAVHWDHEPVWVVPSVWCPAFRRPGPAKAGTPNRRFMESKYRGAFRATSLQSRSWTEFVRSH